MILSIPLKPTKTSLNLSFFENLNIDFWKNGIKKSGQYVPKKEFHGKKELKFSLYDMMRKVAKLDYNYYSYIGSETVPPCSRI